MSFASKVSKIVCIGRNYADHVKELGNKAPAQPFFFLKPPSSLLLPNQGPIRRPRGTQVHYELELAVIIGKRLSEADPKTFDAEQAAKHISGYALGLDLTARNVQAEAKNKGLPWSIAKGFDTFLPLSEPIPKEKIPDPDNAWLRLRINGEVRQDDPTSLMVFKIPQILATVSNVMTLEEGDVVLTGTPKGVGEIVPGDHLHGQLFVDSEEVASLEVDVDEKAGFYEYRET